MRPPVPPPYPPPPTAASAPAAGEAVTARPTWTLENPEPPRRRLGYPREGTEGGEVPREDSGSAGEPEGRDRRALGETWSQLSVGVRVELTRPLRVEPGQTSSPGADPSRRQPDHRDLRQGRPRPPELEKEPADGGGEPSTVEGPRMRARFVDQGERARPPGEGRWHDPMPPPSPGETPSGPSAPSGPVGLASRRGWYGGAGSEEETSKPTAEAVGDARKASKRPNRTEDPP